MAEERTRDRVWKFALNRAYRDGKGIFPEVLADRASVSERTARETLGVMAANGFLEKKAGTGGRVRYDPHPSFPSS